MADTLQDALNSSIAALARYNAVLAQDALNPLESYSIDGESSTRNEWRAGIMQLKTQLLAEIKMLRVMLSGVSVQWLGKVDFEKLTYRQRNGYTLP